MTEQPAPPPRPLPGAPPPLKPPTPPPNPWLAIWFHPRRTVRHILDTEPSYGVAFLAAMIGMLQSVTQILQTAKAGRVELNVTTMGFAVFGGFIVGLLALYLLGFIYRVSGHWFGGQGDSQDVRAAISWPQVPIFLSYLVWFILFYKESIGLPELPVSENIIYLSVATFFSLWSFLLACHTVGEAHGFSAWKGFFTMLAGNLLLLSPLVGVLLVVGLPNISKLVKSGGGSQWKPPAAPAGFSKKAQPGGKPSKGKAAPAVKEAVEIAGVSETDLDLFRLSGEVVRIKLKKGGEMEVPILDYDRDFLYVDTPKGMLNLPRGKVERIDSKRKPAPASVTATS